MPDNLALIRLTESDLALSDPACDIRGRKVLDAQGNELGHVDDLYLDDTEKRVRFLRVSHGGFLGIGASHVLIPVDVITRIDADHVHVDRSREHIASAPQYDPDVVDTRYLSTLYNYYGYNPWWGPGYTYPMYPYY